MAQNEQETATSIVPAVIPNITGVMSAANTQLIATMEQISKVVDKGVIKSLMIVGTLLIWVSLITRISSSIQTEDFSVAFSTIDFLIGVTTGLFFVLLGSAIKLYEYKTLTDWDNETRRISIVVSEEARKLMEKANQAAVTGAAPDGTKGGRTVD